MNVGEDMEKLADIREDLEMESFKESLNIDEDSYKHSEAISHVLKKLDSDESIEVIAKDISRLIGMNYNVSNVALIKVSTDDKRVTTILEWVREGCESISDVISEEEKLKYLDTCSDLLDVKAEENSVLRDVFKLERVVVTPILVNNKPSMFLAVADNKENEHFDKEGIQFLKNSSKILENVLSKRLFRNSIISSYKAIKEILDNIGSGIFVVDKKTRKILFANSIMKTSAGDDMEGKYCHNYAFCGMKHNCVSCDILNEPCAYFETYVARNQTWYDVKFNEITWVDGRKVSLCNITNITEKKKIEKRIEFQANNDFLTGLYNRMRCESDMDKFVAEAVENNTSGCVMFLDLDNFKHINDGLGHQYGDMLLKMISLGLQQIRGIENSCYRMGGDEFVIIVEPSEMDGIDDIIEQIRVLFSKPWDLNGTEYYCTMSMGIVNFPEDGKEVNDLVKKADIAMYDAKKAGKNRIEFYNNKAEKSSIKRLALEKNMRSAIAVGGKEFEVYIQPIIDAETEECIGGEALIRWNSANLGFVTPSEFIPLAEHLGLIVFIGEMFLRRVCSINKKWSDMGIDKKIHINLSIVQLVQNNIVEVITSIIKETGVNPNNIILEVTESLAINDMNNMKKVIKEIKALGVDIALDDFGTGYSSLNYIKQMDFDIIKVDKTFVDDIVSDDYAQTFVKLITELSNKLDVKVCVEGVEKREQLETLKKMKVSMIQGYLFGKPVPYKEYERVFLGIEENHSQADMHEQ